MAKQEAPTNTYTTSVVMPVSMPLGVLPIGKRDKPENWQPLSRKAFEADLTKAFQRATALANWAVRLLFRRDVDGSPTAPESVKKCYLYGEASHPVTGFPGWATDWASATASAQCVLRAVHEKYIRERPAIMGRFEHALLSYKFPQPFPVHNQDWRTAFVDDGDQHGEYPVVMLNLPAVGKVKLRLKRDAGFHRQAAQFRAMHNGTATKGAAALYRNRKGQVLVKMVGTFAREDRGGTPNVCFLHTDPNALLVAEINGRRVTVTNADHMKRALEIIKVTHARHKSFLERSRQDKKREVRMDRTRRRYLNEAVEQRCEKNHRRIKTAVQQVAAQVARLCERQRVGVICYDDSCQAFLPQGFEWFNLKETISRLFVGKLGGGWIDGQFAWLNSEFTEPTSTKEREEWLQRARATLATVSKVKSHKSRPQGTSHPAVSTAPATSSASGGRSLTTSSRATRRPARTAGPSSAPGT